MQGSLSWYVRGVRTNTIYRIYDQSKR